MRLLVCLFALLCVLNLHARAATWGISGTWGYYGNRDGAVRINEESGILEDGTSGASYVLLEEKEAGRRRVARKGASHPGDVRTLLRVHEDLLLFLGARNPILVRAGTRFKTPREKIRGRWHYAAQMNEIYHYDAEFDLDARKMVEISRSEQGGHIRSEDRPLELLLDAQTELALQAGGVVYHFERLGADFLVLEGSYATSARNGYKILMERVQAQRTAKQAAETAQRTDGRRRAAKTKKLAR
ncbi:MAG: hypothetical protein LBI88_04960 [Deltaproteobacteria bacterium]|nr:hypothetical protein [Deltaproteobacteria bacterium]